MAGVRLAARRVRRGRAGGGADRGAGGRVDEVRGVEPAGRHAGPAGGPPVEESVGGRAGVPADEGGTRAGPLRGPLLARLPPPRLLGDAGLRLLASGAATGRGR